MLSPAAWIIAILTTAPAPESSPATAGDATESAAESDAEPSAKDKIMQGLRGDSPAAEPTAPGEPAAAGTGDAAALEAKVRKLFDDNCTSCHMSGAGAQGGLDLTATLSGLNGEKASASDKMMVVGGNPGASYLLDKMYGAEGISGSLMPLGGTALPAEDLEVVEAWISALPTPPGAPVPADGPTQRAKPKGPKPFHGTHQIVLPTTTTLGKLNLQYRIDHRFGRIGTERGAFGLDAGVSMRMMLAYGIFDGWDVQLARANSRKAWEIGTKYVPVRQEDGMPLSFGGYAALSFFRDFDVANQVSGDFQLMLSRLLFERWSLMLTLGYHINTNHNSRVVVELDPAEGPVLVEDTRDTFVIGFASTVWLGKKRRWGIDLEYFLPIPDGGDPNVFYYRGGDADPNGFRIGSWSIGGSYAIGLHFFQVFFTNNREINTNLAAAGGQSGNPFDTPGVDSNNPFHKFNFFLGFNLGRKFQFSPPKKRKGKRKKKAAAAGEGA